MVREQEWTEKSTLYVDSSRDHNQGQDVAQWLGTLAALAGYLGSSFQHLHADLPSSLTPVLGDPVHSSGLYRYQAHTVNIHTHRPNIYTHNVKQILKKLLKYYNHFDLVIVTYGNPR